MARCTTLLLASLLCSALVAQSFDRAIQPVGASFGPMNQCRLSDGGYLMTGFDYDNNTFKMVRVGSSGAIVWGSQLSALQSPQVGQVTAMGELANGDLYMLVATYVQMFPTWNLLRMDGNGNVLWQQLMGYSSAVQGDYSFRSAHVIETSTGDLIVNIPSSNKPLLTKLSASGAPIWSKSFTSTEDSTYDKHPSFDVAPTDDGGVFMCGKDRDWPYVIRTDADGNVVWSQTFYQVSTYSHLRAMEVLPNGDLLFAGMHDPYGAMMRMSSTGTILWLKHFLGSYYFNSMVSLGDGTFLLGEGDFGTLLHVDADGNLLSAFAPALMDYSPGLHCISGADGFAHLAGSLYVNNTSTVHNYVTRFNPDQPPACLFQPTTMSVVDFAGVAGTTGVSTMGGSDQPVTLTTLNWEFSPNAWTSEEVCSFHDAVPTIGHSTISVTPTLLAAGATVNVDLGDRTAAQAHWFSASGARVRSATITGNQGQLATAGLASGLYTLRLSADGEVLHTVRVVVQ